MEIFSNKAVILCSSIKPFTQQAYPIQPAVTTAISSENLPFQGTLKENCTSHFLQLLPNLKKWKCSSFFTPPPE